MRVWLRRAHGGRLAARAGRDRRPEAPPLSPWFALCVAATAALVVAERTGPQAARVVAKSTASAAFVLQGLSLDAGGLLLAALVCSAVGDLCLLKKSWFRAGIVAFGLAHVAFCAVFVEAGVSLAATAAALALTGAFGFTVTRALADRTGSLRGVVQAYAALLCTMTALAVGVTAADPTRWPVLVAAVAFLLSDLLVARDRFVGREWVNRAVGLPLYYGAQLVFATVLAGSG